MKLEFLVKKTLQISLDECRAYHPPPSLVASCGLHHEYENGSGKKIKRVEFQKRWKRRNAGMREKRGGNKSPYLGK